MFLGRIKIGCLVSLLCSSIYAAEQPVLVQRITEAGIEQAKSILIKSQQKNHYMRTLVKVGGCTAGVVAVSGAVYAWLTHPSAGPVKVAQGTYEELCKKVSELENIIKGPQFLSNSWFKYAFWNYILGPAFIVGASEFLIGKVAKSLSSKVFYDPTIAWYLMSTRLGVLSLRYHEDGTCQRILNPGPLALELEYHAALLDDTGKRSIPVDASYHVQRVVAIFNAVIQDMMGLIAFMYYTGGLWVDAPAAAQEALERARYLYNVTNKSALRLEGILVADRSDGEARQLVIPTVKEFFSELEQVLIGFTRIEREHEISGVILKK